jgi:hypothetical protein
LTDICARNKKGFIYANWTNKFLRLCVEHRRSGGGTSDGIFRITRYTIEKNAGDIKTSQQSTAQTAARYIGMMMYSK